jgi:hypothetical protein
MTISCGDRSFNFSQYPGFEEWYASHPPASALPSSDDIVLLEQFKPRFFLPEGHEGPIDFYDDYIAKGRLVDGRGDLVSTSVDRALLNEMKDDPSVVFTHQADDQTPSPVVYGRIDRRQVSWPGCRSSANLTFLTYHLVFRYSGLPADVPAWQAWPLSLFADLDDWHQLDHYTAVTLAFADDPARPPKPITATFQQHNYQRTYVLKDTSRAGHLSWPSDNRLAVDIAIRSNEFYPHRKERARRRAMSFMDPAGARYMAADGSAPWLAADDITDPVAEIDPLLKHLPPNDAFYTFQGWLGERRRLPGRDGPPGADYNTLPAMKPLINQMALAYWYEGAADWLSLYEALFEHGRPESVDPTPFLELIAGDIDLACG